MVVFCLRTQSFFFFLLRMTDFLTLRFPAACQRLGCCLAKSYPGRAIERALSTHGADFSPPLLPAPHLYWEQSHTYHLISALSDTVRKIKPRREGTFAFPPGWHWIFFSFFLFCSLLPFLFPPLPATSFFLRQRLLY